MAKLLKTDYPAEAKQVSGGAMANRRKDIMDIRELLTQLRANASDRQIHRDTGIARRTIKRYREWAQAQGLLESDLPPLEDLVGLFNQTLPTPTPPQNTSSVEPYRAMAKQLVDQNVEIAALYQRLQERGYSGSYSAVYRFVRTLKPKKSKNREATVRVERKPGEEAQVDFGYAGRMIDLETGELRRAWCFVMTLSWSRHQYVEFVFDQKVETWLRLHRNAFEFFGGVPGRVVPDNLKAAILKACWDDPVVQESYRECARHYGFRIAPCRPYTPEHKGKVEQGGVHYVVRNFMGGREAAPISRNNREVLVWCDTTAGLRIHGTTKEKPVVRFEQTEKAQLKPLPQTPYDLAVWKQLKLGRDCYVEFDHAYYSAPHRLIGLQLWVCGGIQQVRIYDPDRQLVATHERALRPGERRTHPDHLPSEKIAGLFLDRETCLATAHEIGSNTLQVVQTLLDDPIVDRLYTVGRLLKLRQKYGIERLEAACQRALAFDDPTYRTVQHILKEGLENQPLPVMFPAPIATTFARSSEELVGHLPGGEAWN
jgi:transposase